MSQPTEKDKRQHVRRAAELAAQLWLQQQTDARTHIDAVTVDVSAAGVAVHGRSDQVEVIDAAATRAEPVVTSLTLPGQPQPVTAIARPRWINLTGEPGAFDMGLQFQEITSRSRDALVAFVLRDLSTQAIAVSTPAMEQIEGVGDIAARIEEKMREINNLLASVVASRDVLVEEVASLRQILLRLVQKP